MPKIFKVDSGLPVMGKNNVALFSKRSGYKQLTRDNGTHITKNFKVNSLSELILNATDKLSSVMDKYPRLGKIILSISEKFIKLSEKLSK